MTDRRAAYSNLGRPGGMCGARGRDREGEIRRSRPRILELSYLGLIDIGQDFDLESSTRRHLRWGGGALRAIRRAVSRWPVKPAKYYPSEHHVRVVLSRFFVWPVKLAKYYP